jgi:predicted nucleic acid-binding protein
VIILDTSGLLAAIDSSQRFHTAAKGALEAASGPLLLSPFVLAELDYMILAHVGRGQEIALLEEVARGTYRLEPFSAEDVARAMVVIKQHADLELGLADASNVVLATRYDTYDILTLDERHFRALAGPQGRPFRLLPADL